MPEGGCRGQLVVGALDARRVEFAHWIHRARFLQDVPLAQAGAYAYTRLEGRTVCGLILLAPHGYPFEDLEIRARALEGVTSGLPADEAVVELRDRLDREGLAYVGEVDHLLGELPQGVALRFWRKNGCSLCPDTECRRDSTRLNRCWKLAIEIGAIDPVEIRDIYQMYRADGETVPVVYERIKHMLHLGEILDRARPRWPDAF